MTEPSQIAQEIINAFSQGKFFVHLRNLPFASMELTQRDAYVRHITDQIGKRTLTRNLPESDLWVLDQHTSPSPDRIPFHTDNPTQKQPERLVSFWNVASSDQGGENVLLPFQSIVDHLEETNELLQRDLTQTPRIFAYQNEHLAAPVFDEQQVLRFDSRYMDDDDQVFAKHLSSMLDELASTHAISLKLQPGDVLFFDNHRVFHAREPYTDPSRLSIRVRLQDFFRTIVSH